MRSPRTGPLTERPAVPPIGGRVVSRVGAARGVPSYGPVIGGEVDVSGAGGARPGAQQARRAMSSRSLPTSRVSGFFRPFDAVPGR
ncbi:hypothetical protein AB0B52_07030 [Streptomyces griseofuscus]|uniref:hypothetical protein n=1 Tax=Streptomyces griseofuscus TaxID=146922 RepID=UPI0033E602A6